MKNIIILLIILLSACNVFASDYIIDGDMVYIDDSHVFLSAEPHTLSESGYVYFNLTSKHYSGNIDFCFGFNSTQCKPQSAEVFINGNWIDISNKFHSIEHDYDGLNKWYYLKEININANVDYTMRALLKINEISTGGKYGVAIKPSFETISQAITNGHFYYLDPWFDGDWQQRKTITLTGGASGSQTNYQMLLDITYDSDMQVDFDDLRFCNETHQLDAWLESKTDSSSAKIWVEFPTTPANTVEADIYMYYGNSGVSSNWDGPNTFLQYHGAATSDFLDSAIISTEAIYEAKVKVVGSADDIYWGFNNPQGAKHIIRSRASNNYRYGYAYDGNSGTYCSDSPKFTTDVWYKLLIEMKSTHTDHYVDGNRISTGITGYFPLDNVGLYMEEASGSGEQEWAFVRKYTANPPTYTFGSEELSFYTPPTPINLQNTSGDYWVNYTWQPGTGNVTDSYNVSFNDTWSNTTTNLFFNQSIAMDSWGNITIYAYNETNLRALSDNYIHDEIYIPYATSFLEITTHSIYPEHLFTNFTGCLCASYIVNSSHPLNFSSLAYLMGVNYTLTSDMHSYLKMPVNNISDGGYRAHNRNTTPLMNWEHNDTITDGNVWQWGGGDYSDHWIVSNTINDTHTWINVTGMASNVFPSTFYLGRNAMYQSPKTGVEINKGQGIIIKVWDLEAHRGRNNDYWVNLFFDTQLEATPDSNIDIWYCNASFNPNNDDPENCIFCDRMDTWSSERWVDHEVWQPQGNVSFAKPLIAYGGIPADIPPDKIDYVYFTSKTVSSKSYILNATNSDPNICNLTFAETETMWLRNEVAGTNTPYAYTPSFFITFVRDYLEFTHHLYIANNNDEWGHSNYNTHTIGISNVPPTHCKYNYFWWDTQTDDLMTGSYIEDFWINVTYGIDPDNGASLTHVLSLCDEDRDFISVINDSLIGNASDIDIFFNISTFQHPSNRYQFRLVSTDNEGTTSTSYSQIFILPFYTATISFPLYLTIIFLGVVFSGISFFINIEPHLKIVSSLVSGTIFILAGLMMFTTNINTYHGSETYLVNYGWVGTFLILIGSVMLLYTILIIYQIFDNEKTINYKGHG